jgi:hypothetical protein
MRFTIRYIFAWTTIICILLFVFRIPLTLLFESSDAIPAFINPFRHLGYIVGIETKYVNIKYGLSTFAKVLFLFGCCLSCFLHVFLVVEFIKFSYKLIKWSEQ